MTVCEFISEPWECPGYMKLLPELQIESISAIEEKKREDKISLYLGADLSPALRASIPPPPPPPV